MSERVRGAIFNMLGDIAGLSVLDAFAGSGALSIEAISRGAATAVAIDIDKNARQIITENAASLGLRSITAVRANVSSWSDNNPGRLFDLVLCDPPYDKPAVPLLQKLTRHVRNDGLLVLSWPGAQAAPELLTMHTIANRSHGDARVIVYAKQQA